MSGGTFDYAQYRIDEIIDRIEREIEQATCERPPMVTTHGVVVKQVIAKGHYTYPYWGSRFETFEQAEQYFLEHGYKEISRSVTEDNERLLIVEEIGTGDIFEILTYTSHHYPPGEDGCEPYYPNYSKLTIETFRQGIGWLKLAAIYANRIDWLISGDDGEESFHERLQKEIDKYWEERL